MTLSRILWACVALLFVVGGAVQFNDPDTTRWVVLYWAAAVVSGGWPYRSALPGPFALGVLVLAFAVEIVSVLWAILLVRDVFAVGTIDLGEEVQREFGGLVVIAVAMSVAVSGARRSGSLVSSIRKPVSGD